ncbi:MAG: hypothetical protein LBD82_00945 [Deltaproteobacteria bacterium]|nr:hypothetical protein [Deltaproteobacteria bacterium]
MCMKTVRPPLRLRRLPLLTLMFCGTWLFQPALLASMLLCGAGQSLCSFMSVPAPRADATPSPLAADLHTGHVQHGYAGTAHAQEEASSASTPAAEQDASCPLDQCAPASIPLMAERSDFFVGLSLSFEPSTGEENRPAFLYPASLFHPPRV